MNMRNQVSRSWTVTVQTSADKFLTFNTMALSMSDATKQARAYGVVVSCKLTFPAWLDCATGYAS